jgi:hypothetical protein
MNEGAYRFGTIGHYGFRLISLTRKAYLSAFPPPLTPALLRLDPMLEALRN